MNYQKMAVCYDTQSCIKCFACIVSCSTENRMRLQRDYNYSVEKSMVEPYHHLNYLRVECNEKGTFPNVTQIAAFKHCQHCENPKCMDICPTLAISKKDTGAVVIDADKCVGCQSCKDACPYDIPVFSKDTGKTYKCTMCHDRLTAGLPTACSAACPSVAIFSGSAEEVIAEAEKRAAHYSKVFNKKYFVYGADKVNNTVGTLSYMTIAPVENRDDYLLPADPSNGVAASREVAKVIGAAAMIGTAAAVAGHAVFTAARYNDKHHKENENE